MPEKQKEVHSKIDLILFTKTRESSGVERQGKGLSMNTKQQTEIISSGILLYSKVIIYNSNISKAS